MKKILIFTAALLLSAAAFADKGYGRIKWEPVQAETLLNLKNFENWKFFFLEGEDIEHRICAYYSTFKFKLDQYVKVYTVYDTGKGKEDLEKSDWIIPRSVFYFLPLEKKDKIYKQFDSKELIIKEFFDLTNADTENSEEYRKFPEDMSSLSAMINRLSNMATLHLDSIWTYIENPEAKDYAIIRVYKYNDDTRAVILENYIKDYIFVFYVYSEPDY